MEKQLLTFLLLLISSLAFAQDDEVLFTVGNDAVTAEEFAYIYKKNNNQEGEAYSMEALQEYLDLYVKFKLKVKAAKEAGLDTLPEFMREFSSYKQQLMKPYLTDEEVSEHLVDEAYQRHQQEVRARHILITLPRDAAPADTLTAYKQALALRDSVLDGAGFGRIARLYSQDPSAKKNEGDLGYFTVFQMIYPFESAAYKLEEGEISMPVRTQFGYHVVEVTDKRPYRGEIEVAHLMIQSPPNHEAADGAIAKARIDSVYQMLQQGADWEEMVDKYSDDYSTKPRGGKLPKFNSFTKFLPEEFVQESFKLEEDGDFSEPFRTPYGWHIVKRISKTELPPKEEMEALLKNKIGRDSRATLSREAAIARLQEEYGFKEKEKNLRYVHEAVDSTLLLGTWEAPEAKWNRKWLFKLNKEKFTAGDFAQWLETKQKGNAYQNLQFAVEDYYEQWVDDAILAYEEARLDEKYPEYRSLVQEYREGILLFNITDQVVWSKAMKDTTGLKAYFEAHQDEYMWDQRVDAEVYAAKSEAVAEQLEQALKADGDMKALVQDLNQQDATNVTTAIGKFERGDQEVIDQVKWQPGVYRLRRNDELYVVRVNEVLPAQPKELKEVRGLVIADYQDYLEQQWLEELRKKYDVEVNEEVLEALAEK